MGCGPLAVAVANVVLLDDLSAKRRSFYIGSCFPCQSLDRRIDHDSHPALLNGGKQIAFLRSTASDPLMPYLSTLNGSQLKPLASQALPADFPAGELGVEFEQLIFPDEVHDFLRHEHWLQAHRAAADFFERHLK